MVRSLKELSKNELSGKRVLVRVDFNVPQDSQGKITDDSRIKAALPTIKYLIANGAKTILVSHLGRPKAKPVDSMRMNPIAERLAELIKQDVMKLDEAIGPTVVEKISTMKNGDVVLLENIRFYDG